MHDPKLVAYALGLLLVVGSAYGQAGPSEVAARKRVRAEALRLRQEIEARPDVELPIGTLLERAHGARHAEDYGEALERYYGVLRRLDRMERADTRVWAAETCWGIGISLRAQGRMLEAAMAFAEVLEGWTEPEWDLRCRRAMKASLQTYAHEMGIEDAAEVREMLAMADPWTQRRPEPRGPIICDATRKGMTAFDRGEYEEALRQFSRIDLDERSFHLTQVMIGRCLQRLGRDDAALEHWGAYVKAHHGAGAPLAMSPALDEARREGVMRATYYLGKVQHERARERFAASGGRDVAGYLAVVERLGTFAGDFPASDVIAPVMGDLLVDSYSRLGRFGEARRVLERLVRDWPGNKFTRAAGRRVVALFGAAGFR